MSFRISSPSIVNSVNGPMKIKGAEVPTPPNDNTIKVRKPYTISKQREKWSEDEHHKFLEALKLYGRAWRCIEEHIGTKTTIQIRSHAQKFFSKMERESAIGGCSINHGSSGEIEIPPPRPKRRSNHPYPRKEGNSHSTPYRLVEDTNSSPIEVLKEITGLTETKLRLFGKSFVIPENESEYSPKSEVSTGTEHISMEAGEISSTILQPISNTKSGVSDDETELVHQSVTSNLDCDEDGQTPNGANSASISMESQTSQQFPSQSCLPALNSMMPFPMYWPYNFGQYATSKDGDGDGYDMNAFDHAATHAFIASAWSSMHSSLSGFNNNVNLLYSPTALMGSFRPQLSATTCNSRKVMGNINDDVDNSKCSAQRNSENERCNAEDSSSDQCFDMASGTRNLSCSDEPSVTKRLKRSNVFDDGGRVSDENVCKSRSTLQSQVPPEVDNSSRVGIISNNEELREMDSHEFDNRPTLPFSLMFQGNRPENDRSAFTNMRTKAKAKPDGNQMNSRPIACSRYSGAGFVPYKRPPLAM